MVDLKKRYLRKHRHCLEYLAHNLLGVRDINEYVWLTHSMADLLDGVFKKKFESEVNNVST